ncbi:hypothetical protein [Methylobacterium sp. WL7]|uniref:hypothetical protein n=1 Tax=Methylobacterium sp. WL7 TaxID=2603900 RepID=UPI0011C7DDBA|nr:hypothetical protein [Methylobacterium sp. WL7]TXN48443.1 hypothetical protein FV233_01765 [Methylobacterium sp. WL7]
MPWIDRAITPNFLPFNEDRRTYDPGIVVETQPVDGLDECPIWGVAPLTKIARSLVPPLMRTAWHARRVGENRPFAMVMKLRPHRLDGRVLSRTPEQATIVPGRRLIVVLPDLVLTVWGSDPDRAYAFLADWMAGTRQRPRLRKRFAKGPAEDFEAIAMLPRR